MSLARVLSEVSCLRWVLPDFCLPNALEPLSVSLSVDLISELVFSNF